MKLGIVIHGNDSETIWNAFRLGVFALGQGDTVKVFLVGKGVESEQIDSEKFKVTEQMATLIEKGGEILACGTCLQVRKSKGTEMCPLSTMKDLYDVVNESDKVLSF